MNPAQQQRLFHPYDRLGAEQTGIPGTGLGLMITRLLVVAMGGQLVIESAAGTGTRARVLLPAARATLPDTPGVDETHAQSSGSAPA
jgi:signal transduction histidine kinase